MALGDLLILEQNSEMGRGGRLYNVAAGTPVYAGEPVQKDLGGIVVYPALTSMPVVGTNYFAGVATTNSTNTTSAAGTVNVMPLSNGITYIANPDVAATWDTQAEYNALVGKRVLLKNSVTVSATPTSGTYTILATDSANNGCVVMAMDIIEHPGKVAFAFRAGASDLA